MFVQRLLGCTIYTFSLASHTATGESCVGRLGVQLHEASHNIQTKLKSTVLLSHQHSSLLRPLASSHTNSLNSVPIPLKTHQSSASICALHTYTTASLLHAIICPSAHNCQPPARNRMPLCPSTVSFSTHNCQLLYIQLSASLHATVSFSARNCQLLCTQLSALHATV